MKLPDNFIDRNVIKYMKDGEERWTLPWAVMVDADMNVWINGEYPAERSPGGTVKMLIRKSQDGIEILKGMERQRPEKGIPWVGASESDLIPVVKIGNRS